MAGTLYVLLLCVLLEGLLAKVQVRPSTPQLKSGSTCIQGPAGIPGNNGVPGIPGSPGRDGRDGRDGGKGEKGEVSTCATSEKDTTVAGNAVRNWKQCVWKSEDTKDIGLIKDCLFTKTQSNTALHVAFQGNIYVRGDLVCKRWFITFNGAECSGPMAIDAALWTRSTNVDNHRHGSIAGYCEGIDKGKHRVGINIGNCVGGYGNSDGSTGWESVSRLMIEEVPPPSL